MAIIKSVSLSEKHAEMVKSQGLSLTEILRDALDIYESSNILRLSESHKVLIKKVNFLQDEILKRSDFIDAKGLREEFDSKDV